MAKLPPALEALFEAIGIRADASDQTEPKSLTEQMIDTFTQQMEAIEDRSSKIICKIARVDDIEGFSPKVIHDKIDARGHDSLVGAIMACEHSAPAATALYRLTQNEEWLKTATFYTDLLAMVKASHDKICGTQAPERSSLFDREFGKKVIGSA